MSLTVAATEMNSMMTLMIMIKAQVIKILK